MGMEGYSSESFVNLWSGRGRAGVTRRTTDGTINMHELCLLEHFQHLVSLLLSFAKGLSKQFRMIAHYT